MRRLTLTAFEAEVGHNVMRIGEKEFATPSLVTRVAWSKDDMIVTLNMDGGEVSMYLAPNTQMDVAHPVQDFPTEALLDLYEAGDDLTAGDGYNDYMRGDTS